MHKIKLITWMVSMSVASGAWFTTPAQAELNHAVTATHVSGSTSIVYGFKPLTYYQEVAALLKLNRNAITTLLGIFNRSTEPNSLATPIGLVPDTERGLIAYAKVEQSAENRAVCSESNLIKVENTCQAKATSTEISAETKVALLQLLQYEAEIEQGLWAYGDELDQSIRAIASSLSQDIAVAKSSCQANASDCGKLNRLVSKTSIFLNSLQQLNAALIKSGQEARLY